MEKADVVQAESAARFHQHLAEGFDAARHQREWLEREYLGEQGEEQADPDAS